MRRRDLIIIIIGAIVVYTVLVVWNSTRVTSADYVGSVVTVGTATLRTRVPVTSAAQTKGLGGVAELSDNEGMMWRYPEPRLVSFWMKGMLIPLDFIWIRDGVVIGITPDVQPPTVVNDQLPIYVPPQPVDRVLEVRAGFATLHDINIGTIVTEK